MAGLDYQLIRSKRRTLALEVNARAQLIVRSPERLSVEIIERFIADKTKWISNKQQLIKQQTASVKHYDEGEKHLYLGSEYPIKYSVKQQTPLLFFQNVFYLNTNIQSSASNIFKTWYQQQAKQYLPKRLAHFADIHQLSYQRVNISRAVSRWGSCSAKNNISLNYRLMLTPSTIIDYIIIHELAHIRHKNHSKDFWQCVEQMMPDYQQAEKWLKTNGRGIITLYS